MKLLTKEIGTFPVFDETIKYENIYIIDSLNWWDQIKNIYDPTCDLILTYDFGLKQKIGKLGGQIFYLDHLVDAETMQSNNFLIYEFFRTWHYDASGNDIFVHNKIPFGFSFRLEFWNDFTFYIRIRICLSLLKKIQIKKLYVGSNDNTIASILDELELPYSLLLDKVQNTKQTYYFPIAQWMDEKLRAKGIRGFLYFVREIVSTIYGYFMPIVDKFLLKKDKTPIFIQEYHPTKGLISELKKDPNLQVVLVNFSRGTKLLEHCSERLIPVSGSLRKYNEKVMHLMNEFKSRKHAKLILSNGEDISSSVYHIIEKRIIPCMARNLRAIDSVISFIDKSGIQLEILIANIGYMATLIDCVCKYKGIPSYLIINGLLWTEYEDESKHATMINSYSVSIRDNYFKGMHNIVCLGDPRMDIYALQATKREINRKTPTVTIGAAAFSNVDLNSYVAVEFDFLYDILSAFQIVSEQGSNIEIIVKVRPSSYKIQYKNFVEEFFPGLSVQIVSDLPIKEVLEKSDFYISTYSQTIIEAACLGIPCVYYKKDNEVTGPPFNKHSELVTVDSINELVEAFFDFQAGNERYNAFLDKAVLEKYIGPLDGKNLERNINFIYEFLKK